MQATKPGGSDQLFERLGTASPVRVEPLQSGEWSVRDGLNVHVRLNPHLQSGQPLHNFRGDQRSDIWTRLSLRWSALKLEPSQMTRCWSSQDRSEIAVSVICEGQAANRSLLD